MLVAGLLAHRPSGLFVFRDGHEYMLVLAASTLTVAILGPGRVPKRARWLRPCG